MQSREQQFMLSAIHLAREGMRAGRGGPFGCVIVKEDRVIAEGCNSIASLIDPTAHAEIVAIRNACRFLNYFQLTGCEIYTSCEPCPMCLGAIYWARPDKVYFANTRTDAAAIGFDDAFIYNELTSPFESRTIQMFHMPLPEGLNIFEEWRLKEDKIVY